MMKTTKQAIHIIHARSKRQRKKQAKRLAAVLGLKQTLFPTPIPLLRIRDEESIDGNFIVVGTAWPDRLRKNCQLAFEASAPEGGHHTMVTRDWSDAYRQLVEYATFDFDAEVAKIPF